MARPGMTQNSQIANKNLAHNNKYNMNNCKTKIIQSSELQRTHDNIPFICELHLPSQNMTAELGHANGKYIILERTDNNGFIT